MESSAAIEYHTRTHREIRRQVKVGAGREGREGGQETTTVAPGRRRAEQRQRGGRGFPSQAKGLRGRGRERGPPTSRAQRRYLAEGKSLRGHPRRLLRSSSGLPYFRVQPRKVVCCSLSTHGAWATTERRIPQGRMIHRQCPRFLFFLLSSCSASLSPRLFLRVR